MQICLKNENEFLHTQLILNVYTYIPAVYFTEYFAPEINSISLHIVLMLYMGENGIHKLLTFKKTNWRLRLIIKYNNSTGDS